MKAHEYDPTAGGRDLDDALLEHFAGEVAQTFGQDIASHHQSYTRLARAVTTLREQLTVSEDDRIVLDDFMGAENDFKCENAQQYRPLMHLSASVILVWCCKI